MKKNIKIDTAKRLHWIINILYLSEQMKKNRDQDSSTESDSASSSPARLESVKYSSIMKSAEKEDFNIEHKISVSQEKIGPPMLDLQEESKLVDLNQANSSQSQIHISEGNRISTPLQSSICHDIGIQTDPINSLNSEKIVRRSGRLAAKKDQKAPLSLKRKLKNPKNPNPKRIKSNENM
ncbi:unnamed protein product [Blepharisma stoltei]|uniref:Uncharacterized protein n=1 Tax=Blepharisma stoltei TaxID=1481888 RepID=A0AAU9JC02_9CILI|nr:unnamed protein product [Blepharisma stoltei]